MASTGVETASQQVRQGEVRGQWNPDQTVGMSDVRNMAGRLVAHGLGTDSYMCLQLDLDVTVAEVEE